MKVSGPEAHPGAISVVIKVVSTPEVHHSLRVIFKVTAILLYDAPQTTWSFVITTQKKFSIDSYLSCHNAI